MSALIPSYALARPPAETLADGIVTFIEREPVDVERARVRWRSYVEALEAAGVPMAARSTSSASTTAPRSVCGSRRCRTGSV